MVICRVLRVLNIESGLEVRAEKSIDVEPVQDRSGPESGMRSQVASAGRIHQQPVLRVRVGGWRSWGDEQRWIGEYNRWRNIAYSRDRKRGPVNLSLRAALVGQNRRGGDALKSAVRQRGPRPRCGRALLGFGGSGGAGRRIYKLGLVLPVAVDKMEHRTAAHG